jgi:hypothetical protein
MTRRTPAVVQPAQDALPAAVASHGVRLRAPVLPWEDGQAYEALLASLLEHHNPVGPTEEHLVEEMAATMWRKQRLRQAEAALYRYEAGKIVRDSLRPKRLVQAALVGTGPIPEQLAEGVVLADVASEDESEGRHAEASLTALRASLALAEQGSYPEALEALPQAWAACWRDDFLGQLVDDDAPTQGRYEARAADLARMITEVAVPYEERLDFGYRHRGAIREQLAGEAFNPDKLETLGRFETGLDRKLEKTLAILLRLQSIRRQGTL